MTRARSVRVWLLAMAALSLFAQMASAEVVIEWVAVGDAGNVADTEVMCCGEGTTGYGAVSYEYRIGKYEVTNAQYAEFLNAVAATDTNELYHTSTPSGYDGISRSGSLGSYIYSAIGGRESMPVNWVSFWDATRFANWLHNGQPTGAQDSTTTEDGAYTLTPTGMTNNTVTRNPGAQVFVTSEDEWYKAAYYDTGTMIYFDYPVGSDTPTTCTVPGAAANTANCDLVNSDPTDAGSYTGSASPSGTFDQGGNVWEWNESIIFDIIIGETTRGVRGGSFFAGPNTLPASFRSLGVLEHKSPFVGFRVASPVPVSPPVPSLSLPALAVLGLALAGLMRVAAKRRG